MTKNAPAAPGSPGVSPMGQLQARQNRNPNSRWDLSDNGEVRMHGGGGLGGPPPIGPGELGPPVLTSDTPGPDGGNVPPHYPIDPPTPKLPQQWRPGMGAPDPTNYSLNAKNKVRGGMGLDALTPPVAKFGGL